MGLAETSEFEKTERRIFWKILSWGLPLFLLAITFLPSGIGPVFRLFTIPSTSMTPNLPLGSFVVVSRAGYGYSRSSFDHFDLPMSGRWPALRLPKRGDEVVFRLPRDPQTVYISRVAGLPGDQVQLLAGRLWINGAMVPRDPAGTIADPGGRKGQVPAYIEHIPEGESYKIIELNGDNGLFDNTNPFAVPPGHYFMLADNRDNSVDSRMPAEMQGVGFVPLELILGPVIATF